MSEEIQELKAQVNLLEGIVMRYLLGVLTKDSVVSLVETLDLPTMPVNKYDFPAREAFIERLQVLQKEIAKQSV